MSAASVRRPAGIASDSSISTSAGTTRSRTKRRTEASTSSKSLSCTSPVRIASFRRRLWPVFSRTHVFSRTRALTHDGTLTTARLHHRTPAPAHPHTRPTMPAHGPPCRCWPTHFRALYGNWSLLSCRHECSCASGPHVVTCSLRWLGTFRRDTMAFGRLRPPHTPAAAPTDAPTVSWPRRPIGRRVATGRRQDET